MGKTAVEHLSAPRENAFPDEWYAMADPSHFWMRWRFSAALRVLDSLGLPRGERLRVLDVGGGAGALRSQIEAVSCWEVDLTDLNQTALENAAPGRGRTLYYDVIEEAPDLVGRYDLVCVFDVIEHLAERRQLLASSLRHIRPGGHLVINVPALPCLFSAYDGAAGHLRRYDRASLAAEVAGLPCDVLDLRYWGASLVPLLALRRLVLGRNPDSETLERGFAPPGALSSSLLRTLLKIETTVVSRPPLGSSLLLTARRHGSGGSFNDPPTMRTRVPIG